MLMFFRPNVEKLEAEGNIQGLIDALQYTDDNEPWAHEATHKVRESATEALSKIGQPSVEPLIAALKDQNVRQAAVEALSKIGQSSVEPLIAALAALKDQNVRQAAVEVLVTIGQPSVEPLIAVFKDEDMDVRRSAAKALEEIGWQPDRNLTGANYWIAKENWTQCINLGELAVEPLIAALKDRDENVRMYATEALEKIGDKRAVEPLIAALKDPHYDVRRSAANALAVIGDERAVEPLIAALKDWHEYVRYCAAHALGDIGDERSVEPFIALLKHKDKYMRKVAVEALGQIGDVRALEPLIATLKDEDGDVRRSATEALGKIGDGRAVEPLIAAHKEQDRDIRKSAVEALGKIRGLSPEQEALVEQEKREREEDFAKYMEQWSRRSIYVETNRERKCMSCGRMVEGFDSLTASQSRAVIAGLSEQARDSEKNQGYVCRNCGNIYCRVCLERYVSNPQKGASCPNCGGSFGYLT